MRSFLGISFMFLFFLLISSLSIVFTSQFYSFSQKFRYLNNQEDFNGFVIIDDLHNNDFNDKMNLFFQLLQDNDFVPLFASEIGTSIDKVLPYADYFVMNSPNINLTDTEINSFNTWFRSGSRNLIISSHFDVSTNTHPSINEILIDIGTDLRVQNDGVRNKFNGDFEFVTNNTIQENYPEIMTNITSVKFSFSNTIFSVKNDTSKFLVNATSLQEQFNHSPPQPEISYINLVGRQIPLMGFDEFLSGELSDRVLVSGSTIWRDDVLYEENYNNTELMINLFNYLLNSTIDEIGKFDFEIPDSENPRIYITFPRNNSIILRSSNISIATSDNIHVSNSSIFINDTLVTNSSNYYWNISNYEEGLYNISAFVFDKNNNSAFTTHFVTLNTSYIPVLNEFLKIEFIEQELLESVKESWLEWIKQSNPDFLAVTNTNWVNHQDTYFQKTMEKFDEYFQDQVNYSVKIFTSQHQDQRSMTIFSRYNITYQKQIEFLKLDNSVLIQSKDTIVHLRIKVKDKIINVIVLKLQDGRSKQDQEQRKNTIEGIVNYADSLGEVPLYMLVDFHSNLYNTKISNKHRDDLLNLVKSTDLNGPVKHIFKETYHQFISPSKFNSNHIFSNHFGIQLNQVIEGIGQNQEIKTSITNLIIDPGLEFKFQPPGQPYILSKKITSIDPLKLEIGWSGPFLTFNQSLVGYNLYISLDNGEYNLLTKLTNETTKYTDGNLIPGHSYSFKLSAISAIGEGDPVKIIFGVIDVVSQKNLLVLKFNFMMIMLTCLVLFLRYYKLSRRK